MAILIAFFVPWLIAIPAHAGDVGQAGVGCDGALVSRSDAATTKEAAPPPVLALAQAWLQVVLSESDALAGWLLKGLSLREDALRARTWLDPDSAPSAVASETMDALGSLRALSGPVSRQLQIEAARFEGLLGQAMAELLSQSWGREHVARAEALRLRQDSSPPYITLGGPESRGYPPVLLSGGITLHFEPLYARTVVLNPRGKALRTIDFPAGLQTANKNLSAFERLHEYRAMPLGSGGAMLMFQGSDTAQVLAPDGTLQRTIVGLGDPRPRLAIELADGKIAVWDHLTRAPIVIDGVSGGVIARTPSRAYARGDANSDSDHVLVPRPDGSFWEANIDGTVRVFAPDGRETGMKNVLRHWKIDTAKGRGAWLTVGVKALPSGRVAWGMAPNTVHLLDPNGAILGSVSGLDGIESVFELEDGGLVIDSRLKWVHCLNSDGSLRWKRNLANELLHAGYRHAVIQARDGSLIVTHHETIAEEAAWMRLDPKTGMDLVAPIPILMAKPGAPILLSNGDLLLLSAPKRGGTVGEVRVVSGSDPSITVLGPYEFEAAARGHVLELEDGHLLLAAPGELVWINRKPDAF